MHYVSIKILETPLLLVSLGEVDTYCSSDSEVHYVSIKILEIPLLLVFLGEVNTQR